MEKEKQKTEEEKSVLLKILNVLKWIIFPVGLVSLLWKSIVKKVKLSISQKITILFTALFLVSYVAYISFVLSMILQSDVESGVAYSVIVGTIIFFVVSTLLFVAFGSLASQNMFRPLRKIINKVDTITANDMSKRLDAVDAQDELRELANQINEMLDKLEESFNRQQNFVSDASHELRTPIAVIQGNIDLIARWGKDDPTVLNESIQAIQEEAKNMQMLVNQLLSLTRLGSFKPDSQDFSLDEVLNEVIAGYVLTRKDREIESAVDENVTIKSDKALVKDLVRIIIDNAIKYTKENGKINVRLKKARHKAALSIEDNGIGISKEDIPKIFDRFYRCDKARGRETKSTGLGLSVAKSITEVLNFTIDVKSTEGKGTKFIITMPLDFEDMK